MLTQNESLWFIYPLICSLCFRLIKCDGSNLVTDVGYCPSWSGFNQTVCQGEFEISKIDIFPFVNHEPTHSDELYSAISFIQNAVVKYKLGAVPGTFDQPLYIKAADIVAPSPDLTNIFIRLGGFHLVMSYLGSICYIMGDRGLYKTCGKLHMHITQ